MYDTSLFSLISVVGFHIFPSELCVIPPSITSGRLSADPTDDLPLLPKDQRPCEAQHATSVPTGGERDPGIREREQSSNADGRKRCIPGDCVTFACRTRNGSTFRCSLPAVCRCRSSD